MHTTIGRAPLNDVGVEQSGAEVLSWEGRLDNRTELALQLRDALRGRDAVEAIVAAAYERWGVPGLARLIGDWSVVIRDAARDTIVLASDYMGVRPLYYAEPDGQRLLWSHRLQSLVQEAGANALDEQFVAGYLSIGGYPNRTPYVGIHSVPPGHAVCVRPGGVRVEGFWAPPTSDSVRYRDEQRYDEELRSLFAAAVAVRMQSGEPVLAELSGGLDSSSVVCMAHHLMRHHMVAPRPFSTVSYVYPDSLDMPFIREVESFCGAEGTHLSIQDHALMSELEVGEARPGSWVPMHRMVAALMRRSGARVFMTGENGDLAMGNWFDDSLQVAAALRRGRLRQAVHEAAAWSRSLNVPTAAVLYRGALAALPSSVAPRRLHATDPQTRAAQAERSLVPAFAEITGVLDVDELLSPTWQDAPPERRNHFRALALVRELRLLQAPEILQDVDVTHPFTHRPLVEYVLSLPADVLCGPGEPRRLMRRAFADLWPRAVQERRSSTFSAPWIEIMRDVTGVLQQTAEWQVVERGWVEPASLFARLHRLLHRLDCNEAQLRQILILECWLRKQQGTLTSDRVRQIA
jgi:asparagine synthase (glutamine-hydrolysing)